jgi:N-acetylneuraminic acid mutarotase
VGSAIYVLGGSDGHEDNKVEVLKFDSMQGTWSEIAPAPRGISGSAAIGVGTDIYVFGGEDEFYAMQDSVVKYDTLAGDWSTLASMPCVSVAHNASICNGLVYIVGAGDDGQDVLSFDPTSEVWITLSPTPSCRQGAKSFVLGGILYMAGGIGNIFGVDRYDVATDTWTALANMLVGRDMCGAVTIGSAGPAEEQDLFDSLIDKASRRQP